MLAHEFPKDQKAWTPFARELAARGVDALTFDFRGYGETGGTKDVAKIDRDMESAVRFIRSRDYAQVYVIDCDKAAELLNQGERLNRRCERSIFHLSFVILHLPI